MSNTHNMGVGSLDSVNSIDPEKPPDSSPHAIPQPPLNGGETQGQILVDSHSHPPDVGHVVAPEESSENHAGVSLTNSDEDERHPRTSNSGVVVQERRALRWSRGELLGEGAFGKVYLAMNIDNGELFAVKQVAAESKNKSHADQIAALEKEIELLGQLEHPNILRYLGTETDSTWLSIFLEFAPGGSIASLLGKFGRFDEGVIRRYARDILCGLAYLHSRNFLHRDIKGTNILVDASGQCKLADFGCSRALGALERATSLCGTPQFMAPEVIRNAHGGYGWQADIWSTGCVIFEMATGSMPWDQMFSSKEATMFHIATSKAHPPFPDYLSPSVCEFLTLCFKPLAAERPSAEELLKHPFFQDSIPSPMSSGTPISELDTFGRAMRPSIGERSPMPGTPATRPPSSGQLSFDRPKNFVGRSLELKTIQTKLAALHDTVKLVYLFGGGGVGKTCLAQQLQATLGPACTFSVHIDLKGTTMHPLEVHDAMTYVIRTRYPETQLPKSDMEARDLYLSCFAHRSSMIFLDDAFSADQVSGLLPRSECIVIVTSRRNLGLESELGAVTVNLTGLPPADAIALLQTISGQSRQLSTAKATVISDLCGHLPLALKTVGSTLAKRPNLGADEMITLLRSEKKRLELVEKCVRISYDHLSPASQTHLLILSVFPADFDGAAFAAILEESYLSAQEYLSELLENSLLEFEPRHSRYHLHDSVRLFTMHEAVTVAAESVDTWRRRFQRHYLEVVHDAGRTYDGGKEGAMEGLKLFARERVNIEQAMRWAREQMDADFIRNFAEYGRQIFKVVLHPSSRMVLYEQCVDLAKSTGDTRGVDTVLHELGECYTSRGLFTEAKLCFRDAISRRTRSLGSHHPAVADSTAGLAWVLHCEGKVKYDKFIYLLNCLSAFEEAEKLYRQAMSILEESLPNYPVHPTYAAILAKLALLFVNMAERQGEGLKSVEAHLMKEAHALFIQALESTEEALGPTHPDVANLVFNMAFLFGAQGQLEQQKECYQRALHIREMTLGPDHPELVPCLKHLADISRAESDAKIAEELEQRASSIEQKSLGAGVSEEFMGVSSMPGAFPVNTVDISALLLPKAVHDLQRDHTDTLHHRHPFLAQANGGGPVVPPAAEGVEPHVSCFNKCVVM